MANNCGDGRDVLVVEDGDLLAACRGFQNMLSDGHHSWVVIGCLNLADTNFEEVRERALHANSAFVTNREDGLSLSSVLEDIIANISDDT